MPQTIDIDGAVALLKPEYDNFKATGGLQGLLRTLFEADFSLSGYPVGSDPTVEKSSPVSLYLSAIAKAFYGVPSAPDRLTNDDRERVVLALLASQGAIGNLAIHVYLGLMEGVKAVEIVDILFLAGIYSGVNHLSQSLKVADVVFLEVVKMAGGQTVPGALKQIIGQFPEEKALSDRLQGAPEPRPQVIRNDRK